MPHRNEDSNRATTGATLHYPTCGNGMRLLAAALVLSGFRDPEVAASYWALLGSPGRPVSTSSDNARSART